MTLKPLPHEKRAKTSGKKKMKFKKHRLYTKGKKKLTDHFDKLFQRVSQKLLAYIKKKDKFDPEELSDLILDLQKTILNLQRKKLLLTKLKADKLSNKEKKKKLHFFPKTFKISKLS